MTELCIHVWHLKTFMVGTLHGIQSKRPIAKTSHSQNVPVGQIVPSQNVPMLMTYSNRFDNRLNVCIHDTAGCPTGCQTGDDLTRDVLTMEGRFDWGRYDFGTFRRRDVLTMGPFDCKAVTRGSTVCVC